MIETQCLPLQKEKEIVSTEEKEERAEIEEAFIHDAQWATQSSGAPSSTIVPDRLTTLGLPHSDPISAMRPAVYPPVTLEGRPSTNENSSFQFGQELGESAGLLPGLYKPAVPDPQHDTWISSFRAHSSEEGPPSPPRTSRAHSSSSRPRTGIVFPFNHVNAVQTPTSTSKLLPCLSLLPCNETTPCPHVRFPQTSLDLHSVLHAKGVVNALQRYTTQPNAHLHGGAGVLYKQK